MKVYSITIDFKRYLTVKQQTLIKEWIRKQIKEEDINHIYFSGSDYLIIGCDFEKYGLEFFYNDLKDFFNKEILSNTFMGRTIKDYDNVGLEKIKELVESGSVILEDE